MPFDEIKIERGVPLPPENRRNVKYPWDRLRRGDSFFVAAPITRVAPAASHAAKRRGWELTTRPEKEGTRVWRVK